MNLVLALLLQADTMGKKPTVYTPGGEGAFSRVMIVLFILGLAGAAAGAVWMVCRGAAGASKTHNNKERKNED